jgi:hypothetical protein
MSQQGVVPSMHGAVGQALATHAPPLDDDELDELLLPLELPEPATHALLEQVPEVGGCVQSVQASPPLPQFVSSLPA